jgi:hypothetical protein
MYLLMLELLLRTVILLAAAKSHRSSPFPLVSSWSVYLPVIFLYAGSFPSLTFTSPSIIVMSLFGTLSTID